MASATEGETVAISANTSAVNCSTAPTLLTVS
jgi:hypothetical protein